jgi:hypothetical protein
MRTRTIERDGEQVEVIRLWGEFYFEPAEAEAISDMADGMGVNRRDLFENTLKEALAPMLQEWEAGREAREAAGTETRKNKTEAAAAREAKRAAKDEALAEKLKARADAAMARLQAAQEKLAQRAATAAQANATAGAAA